MPTSDKDVGSLLNEAFRRSQADTAVTAGDEHNLSAELFHLPP